MQLKINWFWKWITSNGLIIRYKYLFLTKYVLFIQFSLYLFLICECASFTLTSVANYRHFTTVFLLGDNHLLGKGCGMFNYMLYRWHVGQIFLIFLLIWLKSLVLWLQSVIICLVSIELIIPACTIPGWGEWRAG